MQKVTLATQRTSFTGTIFTLCFAFLFAAAFIAGLHIHTAQPFNLWGLSNENYLEPLTAIDLIVFSVVAAFTAAVAFVLQRFVRQGTEDLTFQAVPLTWFLGLAAVLFAAWLPYLLAYWPGLVFGDTITSFRQLSGNLPWSNHHPVPYTLFIDACLKVGQLLGNLTWGVALYSTLQMIFMASCLSYIICWARVRTNIPIIVCVAFVALFALLPYYATSSIALWKDIFFSCALAVLSVMLADLVLSYGKVAEDNRLYFVALIVMTLPVVFFRNNGILVIGLIALAVLLTTLGNRRCERRVLLKAAGSLAATALVGFLAVTLVYPMLGIQTPKKESVGIPLSQMANVVVSNGSMTQEDRDYLDALLPLDNYAETYMPCIVDSLKNSGDSNMSMLENRSEFFGHWIDLGIRNPDLYLEAWVLETYGFWTVNRPETYLFTGNITIGVPRNTDENRAEELRDWGIEAQNLLGDNFWRDLFPLKSFQIPTGLLLWAILLLAVTLINSKSQWIVPLVPSIALVITLLIASPIFYWPRYALTLQILIPFYFAMYYLVFTKGAKQTKD